MTRNLIGILALGAAVTLTSCATTSLASAPPQTAAPTIPTTTTVAPTTTTTVPATTTTTAPPTTTTTVPPTTTTTLPKSIVMVGAADPPIVAVGTSNGAETERAQWRLLELGFWLQNANGDYGITTRQAVMAFQKYHGLTADGSLGEETAAAMTAAGERPHGRTDAGTLVEIDKGLQVLFFVIDGRSEWILNVSTGSEVAYREPDQNSPGDFQVGDSVTRNGLHDVYREREEGWWEGDLGEIYRPKYFTGGIALHGSNNVPNYPASHGCVRVSVPAMDWVWETGIMPLHVPVWVHDGVPGT